MLENPTFGWCGITLGAWHINNASYLEDYPLLFADSFLWAIGHETGHTFTVDPDDNNRCLVKIDCEGDWWTFEVSKDHWTIWHMDPGEDECAITTDASPKDWRLMCVELARDIESHLHEWTMWGSDASASVDEANGDYSKAIDYIQRRQDLISLVADLRNA